VGNAFKAAGSELDKPRSPNFEGNRGSLNVLPEDEQELMYQKVQ
jgi:hypothetical protein